MDAHDLAHIYSAARAWIDGANPYDGRVLADLAASLGIVIGPGWSLHPPAMFVLLSPLAALPWPVAMSVSIVTNVVLAIGTIAMAMSIARLSLQTPRGLGFAAFSLALAPVHTTISEGQLTIATTALVVGACAADLRERPAASGVFIALAAALRPQVGLIFVLLFLVRGQWGALASCVVTLTVVAAIAVGRLAMAGVDWLPTLVSNLAGSGVADATGSATQRLNLQALLHPLLPGQGDVPILFITAGVGVGAMAILVLGLRRRVDREATLLRYAGFGVITLLMVYNRSYSATLLILPLAWAFAAFRPPSLRAAAAAVCVASAVFVVPGAAALARVRAPAGLGWLDPWWTILQLHQVLAMLVVLAALLVAARHRPDGAVVAPSASRGA